MVLLTFTVLFALSVSFLCAAAEAVILSLTHAQVQSLGKTRAAEIMRRLDLKSCIVVSDGYHIYRVKKMLESQGMDVFGSPRPSEPLETWQERWLYFRQAIAYCLWRVGIAV